MKELFVPLPAFSNSCRDWPVNVSSSVPTYVKQCLYLIGIIGFFMIPCVSYAMVEPHSLRVVPSKDVRVHVDASKVVKRSVAELFGFNIPWINFQRGYWRNGHVRAEIIEWLKPFTGAIYRYPGGEISSWYEWEKAIGKVATRVPQHAKYNQYAVAEFGFDEFLDFVKSVNGVPLVTANLVGTKDRSWSNEQSARSNSEWLKYTISREGLVREAAPYCETGKRCPVRFWELGNELDWGDQGWLPDQYVSRARIVADAMFSVDSSVQLIAQMATAPWSEKGPRRGASSAFNIAVGRGLSSVVGGYSMHPYYDGLHIPAINRYEFQGIDEVSSYSGVGSSPKIFITEHAKWPAKPILADWKNNWPQTGDISGAVSTADFLLSQMLIPNVSAAMWHALGSEGPWQLFYVNLNNDQVYPNVVYWGLRVLRSGVLDDVLQTTTFSTNASGYKGGYDVRAVAMADRARKQYSLLVVNRSGFVREMELSLPQLSRRIVTARYRSVASADANARNSDDRPNRITMSDKSVVATFDHSGRVRFELPPNSVSSFMFDTIK